MFLDNYKNFSKHSNLNNYNKNSNKKINLKILIDIHLSEEFLFTHVNQIKLRTKVHVFKKAWENLICHNFSSLDRLLSAATIWRLNILEFAFMCFPATSCAYVQKCTVKTNFWIWLKSCIKTNKMYKRAWVADEPVATQNNLMKTCTGGQQSFTALGYPSALPEWECCCPRKRCKGWWAKACVAMRNALVVYSRWCFFLPAGQEPQI